MEFKDAIQQYAEEPLTRQIIFDLLKEYKRPYDKISELAKQGILIPLKRGIYITGSKLSVARPGAFLLANSLLGPSYVSLDAALSYWNLIPERVYEISSVTTRGSKTYRTPAGRFSYTHIPLPYYSFGIKQVRLTDKQTALVATPEKALCDKVVTTSGVLLRSTRQTLEFLTEDLRIEEQLLRGLAVTEMGKWVVDAPKKNSIAMLIKALKTL